MLQRILDTKKVCSPAELMTFPDYRLLPIWYTLPARVGGTDNLYLADT